MANNKITSAGLGVIVKSLCTQRMKFDKFDEIDFSRNSLKGAAFHFSTFVASFPTTITKALRKVNVANSALDLAPLLDVCIYFIFPTTSLFYLYLQGIRNTLFEVIENLNLSGNKMDEHATKLAIYLFEKSTSLKEGTDCLKRHFIYSIVSSLCKLWAQWCCTG